MLHEVVDVRDGYLVAVAQIGKHVVSRNLWS